jgi:hypothetical protein
LKRYAILKKRSLYKGEKKMNDKTAVVDAQVVDASVVNPSLEAINVQKADFTAQLAQVRKDMAQHQQSFESLKLKGLKLEGALESLELLLKSLQK